MKCDKYCFEHTVENYHEIFDLIQGRENSIGDIRQKCIFRGLSNDSYELEPSSLRRGGLYLNNFIASNDMPKYKVDKEIIEKNSIKNYEFDKSENIYYLRFDKYNKFPKGVKFDPYKINIMQIRKELKVLMDFIDFADKSGLKININQDIRELIENEFDLNINHWPHEDFYEVIALAQHYGTPTRFLDWSYDYNVSIYFAVKDILNYNEKDYEESKGVLWAFNYKLFDTPSHSDNLNETFKLRFYRPAYYSNPYLNAQFGVFTFILNDLITWDRKPLNELIIDDFKKNMENSFEDRPLKRSHSLKDSDIPKNEKIFYKFIIPPEFKPKILEELYLNNYSEEFLFPGYGGVTQSIKNKVILKELIEEMKKN